VLAAIALQEFEKFDSEAQAKKNVVRAIETVAEKLGNTPSVCRKCYVHPAVLDSYMDGTMVEGLLARAEEKLAEDLHDLQPEEAAVLAMLQQRLAQDVPEPKKVQHRRKAA
jgi:DNA topoisomerase-1